LTFGGVVGFPPDLEEGRLGADEAVAEFLSASAMFRTEWAELCDGTHDRQKASLRT
jgi:hypothetical protein